MNDGAVDDPHSKLAELLKHPDDLDKLLALKTEFTRKKAAIDGQLNQGLKDQLEVTQNGMSSITEGQKIVQEIKEEMMRIDKLCEEAQNMIRDFPEINRMSVMQRNFAAVEGMMSSIATFSERLAEMEELLREDDQEMDVQSNLLAIHEGLSGLREVREQAMEQVKSTAEADSGLELINNLPLDGGATLRDLFAKLDDVVDWFDEHVGEASINVIRLVQAGSNGIVVRLALVIEEEEKKDRQVRALQEAQKDFGGVAARFKSITVGQRELRGYKKKFLQAVEASAAAQFEVVKQTFLEEPDKIEKSCRWFFNDLNTVKLGMQELMPKKWKIFQTYTQMYHTLMHDFLVSRLDDPDITPVHMLAILNWVPKYYNKMTRLGVPENQLMVHVIDDRESDLVREYRTLITKAVEEWMDRMAQTDRQSFRNRAEGSLDLDADHALHTKSLGDMWIMLREQLAVAESSGRPDVVDGVVDAMYRALKGRHQMWEKLVEAECRKIESAADITQLEGVSSLQDWLAAIANDQIAIIDDNAESGTAGFLARFRRDYEPLVSPSYTVTIASEHDALVNGYVDLSTLCMQSFAGLVFSTDFREAMREFFTQQWYSKKTMAQITTTFDDYLTGENNYTDVLHPSLRDILVEELGDTLLVRYLSAIRNKNAIKFRRSDPFMDKIKDDIQEVFRFFGAQQYEEIYPIIKEKWRAVLLFGNLLSADKGPGITTAFEEMKAQYWDVHIGWVESVLRMRDDFDRGMLSAVKTAAAALSGERGTETVMSKVK